MSQRALSQYQQIKTTGSVEDASPHRLIQMLMQGFLQRVAEARGAMLRKDIPAKGVALGKAINIAAGLQGSLNMQVSSELPRQLDALYDYMQRRLVQANLENDMAALDEVADLMRKIKEGWDGIEAKVAQG